MCNEEYIEGLREKSGASGIFRMYEIKRDTYENVDRWR